jgi:hypothetical protein
MTTDCQQTNNTSIPKGSTAAHVVDRISCRNARVERRSRVSQEMRPALPHRSGGYLVLLFASGASRMGRPRWNMVRLKHCGEAARVTDRVVFWNVTRHREPGGWKYAR